MRPDVGHLAWASLRRFRVNRPHHITRRDILDRLVGAIAHEDLRVA